MRVRERGVRENKEERVKDGESERETERDRVTFKPISKRTSKLIEGNS